MVSAGTFSVVRMPGRTALALIAIVVVRAAATAVAFAWT